MGKAGSKLKKKKRSQSIAWSFRFPSLSTLSRRKMPLAQRPHLDVRQWLNILELAQYAANFDKFDGVEDLLSFSEADIKDLGVKNSAHRARIVSSLVALRTKYEKGNKKKEQQPQRHSVAVDSGRLVQQNGASDILVVTDVIQSKSLCNLVMEATQDPGVDPAQLKKALEWELSLDSRDLRSHAWYHGAIPRHRAEEIVERDGEFLVRDCASQPGNYVLTCRCKGQGLHFVINKVVIQPDTVYERVQYQFEDDAYDTVPDLITYYVGSGKAVSATSGARVHTPRNRAHPLSFYAAQYGSPLSSPLSSAPGALRCSPYSSYRSPVHSPPRAKRDAPPRLPAKKQRSHSLTPAELNGRAPPQQQPRPAAPEEKSSSADGVIQNCGGARFSTHSLPRPSTASSSSSCRPQQQAPAASRSGKMVRVTSDPALSPCLERRHFGYPDPGDADPPGDPPPKPSRVPSEARPSTADPQQQRVASYHASSSDSGNGSGDSAQSSAAGDGAAEAAAAAAGASAPPHRGVVIKNPRYHAAAPAACSSSSPYDSAAEDSLLSLSAPDPDPPSAFDLENFSTLLLPATENRPLDATALQGVRVMLRETGPRILASHLTATDLELVVGGGARPGGSWEADLGLGVSCGLELCALPHGRQLRRDLVERTQCLKLLVAVTILTCPTESERAETLNKWIQVAIDIKTALGDLYGFCGVMMGLCMPQIQRLDATWHVLRQKFTDSAFNFEAKLRPTLKHMNECTNPQAPNTTIPHLLPFVLLQERTLDDILGANPEGGSSLVNTCLGSWESSTADFGLGTLYAHLEAARRFGESLPMFRRNAEIVLGDAKEDELLTDMFRTEFQLKFLWGSRGAGVAPEDRHAKFEQVLGAMSEKCEPSPAAAGASPSA
ncbi:breast cancer anti-estrogen resistance protein 3 homolog [Bacillus rossius redtenbacheri]|uniref:breast cancer anti-estrogen resistance protein 3 homolog n=1 Tax=Bacillus rossius redtenbacheri TaxID=93214 RepID=UPI002FDDC759